MFHKIYTFEPKFTNFFFFNVTVQQNIILTLKTVKCPFVRVRHDFVVMVTNPNISFILNIILIYTYYIVTLKNLPFVYYYVLLTNVIC